MSSTRERSCFQSPTHPANADETPECSDTQAFAALQTLWYCQLLQLLCNADNYRPNASATAHANKLFLVDR
jgi:hypothetical protein